jgi:hypothetical protein
VTKRENGLSEEISDLAAFWRRLEVATASAPIAHPDDLPFFRRHRPDDLVALDADSFERHPRARDPYFNHLSLIPVPYVGDLKQADIFVLMLNPGFSRSEYRVEADPAFSARLRKNLQQEFAADSQPFWYLAPDAARHPGYTYWHSRLAGLGSMSSLGRRLAVIERFAYHSAKFGSAAISDRLPSTQAAKRYVHDVILPRVLANEVLLVVARGATAFGITARDERSNLVVYGPDETASAWLTPNSRGGAAILKWIAARQARV